MPWGHNDAVGFNILEALSPRIRDLTFVVDRDDSDDFDVEEALTRFSAPTLEVLRYGTLVLSRGSRPRHIDEYLPVETIA